MAMQTQLSGDDDRDEEETRGNRATRSLFPQVNPRPDHEPVPPSPDPQAIRACLTPDVAAEFDAEWNTGLPAIAARTPATGQIPAGSISGDEMKALIRKRLGR